MDIAEGELAENQGWNATSEQRPIQLFSSAQHFIYATPQHWLRRRIVTRKWKIVLSVLACALLLGAAAVAAMAHRNQEQGEQVRRALAPLLAEGTTRVTAAMRIALAADAVDYSAAVEAYRQSLFELEQKIQEVESTGDASDRRVAAALLYLKSGQSVIRELHRDRHTATALQNANARAAASRQQDEEEGVPRDRLYNVHRQAWELTQDRKMTNGRLAHAARMFHKNIEQYGSALGPEHLAPPDMVKTLIARIDPPSRRSP